MSSENWKEERLENDEVASVYYNPNHLLEIAQQRVRLPIFEYKDHILYLLEKCQVLIIEGQTGCGKSTQIPQYLLEAGWCGESKDRSKHLIGITEPRRVAAINLANRVAFEMNTTVGKYVGYTIRFEDVTSSDTKIKYLTEGILINEMMSDPLLKSYSVIMVDETHERTLYTDILLGLLKKILQKRSEFRVIISSATLETEVLRDFFMNTSSSSKASSSSDISTKIIRVQGRQYPVDVYYSNEPIANYIKSASELAIKIHETQASGDILIFLTGLEEVEQAVQILLDYSRSQKDKETSKKINVLPLHGSLPSHDQLKVFARLSRHTRKIIVATNIAEASVTIDGIVYVIDSGFVKLKYYNPKTQTDCLTVVPISKASAWQRAGRAGRTRAGKVFRLYSESEYEKLEQFTIPEISRSNLASVILQLKALGIKNIADFEFPVKPPETNMITALELLYALDAIDDSVNLTDPIGLNIAEFPLQPQFAKMLLTSEKFNCTDEILTISAMLQVQNIFQQPSSGQRSIQARNAKHAFSVIEGDLITYLNVYNAFINSGKVRSWADKNYLNYKGLLRAIEIRSRLQSILNRFKIKSCTANGDLDSIRKCIVTGFFANAAYFHPNGYYKTIRGNYELHIHPTSVLFTLPKPPKCVLFVEVLHTTKEFMRDVTSIEMNWLYELAPHFYDYGTDRELNERRLMVNRK